MVGGRKMLKVFGRVKSRAFRVVWLLEELEAPYHLAEIAPRSEEAKKLYKNGICLPSYPDLKIEELNKICNIIIDSL